MIHSMMDYPLASDHQIASEGITSVDVIDMGRSSATTHEIAVHTIGRLCHQAQVDFPNKGPLMRP